MRIHTKILRKPLNNIWFIAQKFIDELRESQNLQRGIFRPVVCPEVLPTDREEEHRFLDFYYIGFPLGFRTKREILL